ncbi:MAG: dTMP kinase [Gammaproteobacteria bacterium]|nr:dTMP kinase [Gammaproteobacteria bacterium]
MYMNKLGFLISFEGIEACGKSTQIAKLSENLIAQGYDVLCSREPGGTPFGDRIREIFLGLDSKGISAETELCLLGAARIEHIRQKIMPALHAGKVVILDRFSDASIAYQGYGRGMGYERVVSFHKNLNIDLIPDLTILLDCDLNESANRLVKRGKADRIEQEKQDFFATIRNGYLEIAKREPERFVIIEAKNEIELIAEQVLTHVLRKIG